MKELLTEWRKFVNEVENPRLKEWADVGVWMGKQEFADPDVTIDTLMEQMLTRLFVMATQKKWKSWVVERVLLEII